MLVYIYCLIFLRKVKIDDAWILDKMLELAAEA